MILLTLRAAGLASEILNCLSLDLGLGQLVPLSNRFYKRGILKLVGVGCRYCKASRAVGC